MEVFNNNNVTSYRRFYKPTVMYRWLFKRFDRLPISAIEVAGPDGIARKIGKPVNNNPIPRITIYRQRAIFKVLKDGMLGWAEAYINNDWDTPDLFALTNWAMANEQALESGFQGTFFSKMLNRLFHLLRPNSRSGSKKNIAAHYDLGNSFYQQWLDRSMTYSSAIYEKEDDSLEQAQSHKYQRIIKLLKLQEQQSVLEIGCGWGGFAEAALKKTPLAHYKGITLSLEQLAYVKNKLKKVNLNGTVCLEDYRDVSGQYDRIVSIEMIEAVGEARWGTYFQTIANRLQSSGMAVIQAITIEDERFEDYRQGVDFIQKHIFPGGMLPSDSKIRSHVKHAGLKIEYMTSFADDYARTLEAWYNRFNDRWAEISKLGFDNHFRRMWNYYFAYCQAGFKSGSIDVSLYVLTKDNPL
ncbi:MAG: cyclopropane-fatty-acyl-phospholipid synthase [Endozoicomonas sp. (ex Botrylloides leachii)]|nr:cyclopropane-fatty-acyl-phospholipid synthase [Endozoicomonas sp. (ex Botrylloides leachii)]